jgi:hypothetical protein
MKHCERAPLAANEKMFLLKTLENRHAMLCFLLFAGGGGLPRKFFPPLSSLQHIHGNAAVISLKLAINFHQDKIFTEKMKPERKGGAGSSSPLWK